MSQYRTTPDPTRKTMPPGIPFIIGNEVAERFSFYGMKSILVIFMTKHLLDSAGNPAFMNDEQAKGVYHLFTAAAYFFPLVGAIISDVVLGKYRTILFLSLMYCVGHGCLAVMDVAPLMDQGMRPWLYVGLLFIAMGAGAIKPCVSAHVGDQFGTGNKGLIQRVFMWFYFSINVGAMTSTLLTPVFLDRVGPWLAFGVPGVLMAVATFVFWLGRNRFIHVPPAGGRKFMEETFSPEGKRALLNLAPIFLIFIPMFWAIFDQTGSAWVIQADGMDRHFAGVTWLPSQIQAVNPLLILILIPTFTYAVYPFLGRFFKVTPLRRIGIGLFVTAMAFTISGLIEVNLDGGFVTRASSTSEVGDWRKPRIIDGEADGYGWSSGKPTDGAAELPAEVTIRLRERSAWTIAAVEIDPYAVMGPATGEVKEAEGYDEETYDPDAPDTANWARRVTVLYTNAADDDFILPADQAADGDRRRWREAGTIELERERGLQRLTFDPVEATHVRLRIESNWGGPRVKLGQVRVLASGDAPPALAGGESVWPDVAGAGAKPNIGWQFLAYIILTAAEVMVSITSLEFAYTQAPKKMKSFIMGIYFLGVSLGNLFTSAVNFVLDQFRNADGSSMLEGADYYWFFTALMAVTSVAFVFVALRYKGQTFIQGEEEEAAAEAEGPDAR